MKTHKISHNYYDYPMHKILKYVFKIGSIVYADDVIFDQLEKSSFFTNITDLARDFVKLKDGKGYIKYSGWNIYSDQKSISIKFIYNDYKLQKVEYKDLDKNKIYKSFVRK